MNRLVHEIKPEAYDIVTVEEALEVADMVRDLNMLVDEGFIRMEENKDGEPTFYPND